MPNIELDLKFTDRDELIAIKEIDVIKTIPLLQRAVSCHNANWEDIESDLKVSTPINIPFPYAAGNFVFTYLLKYQNPEKVDGELTVELYKEANQLSLDELTQVIELANFLECLDFVQSIAFIIADKVKDFSVEQLAQFMGVDIEEPANGEEDAEWMHPPLAALRTHRPDTVQTGEAPVAPQQ